MQNSRCFWLIAFAFLKKLEYEWERVDIIFSTLSSTFAWKKELFLEILVQKLQLLFLQMMSECRSLLNILTGILLLNLMMLKKKHLAQSSSTPLLLKTHKSSTYLIISLMTTPSLHVMTTDLWPLSSFYICETVYDTTKETTTVATNSFTEKISWLSLRIIVVHHHPGSAFLSIVVNSKFSFWLSSWCWLIWTSSSLVDTCTMTPLHRQQTLEIKLMPGSYMGMGSRQEAKSSKVSKWCS